ncbi:MAG: DUF2442 domain-containing protein [Oscillospiraceae bacterium]|nr:DUF2442 domain-containing protein [Oscillospiraceae bacterium]
MSEYIFHLIERITPLPDYKLEARFQSGESRLYDVKPLKDKWPVFEDLFVVSGLFDLVYVDCGGHGVVWNENLDLDSEEIWCNGIPIEE